MMLYLLKSSSMERKRMKKRSKKRGKRNFRHHLLKRTNSISCFEVFLWNLESFNQLFYVNSIVYGIFYSSGYARLFPISKKVVNRHKTSRVWIRIFFVLPTARAQSRFESTRIEKKIGQSWDSKS